MERLGDVLKSLYPEGISAEAVSRVARLRVVPSGFIDLDRLTGGLHRSDLIAIGGWTASGKTALALNIARNLALTSNLAVAIFSAEMSSLQLSARFLSMECSVESRRLRTGQVTQQELLKIANAFDVLENAPLYIDGTPWSDMNELMARVRRLSDVSLGLAVFDYLQLLEPRPEGIAAAPVSEIVRTLKELAREFDIPVVAVTQLILPPADARPRPPRMADVPEPIEGPADVIFLVHREEMLDPNTVRRGLVDILLAKNRGGPTGSVTLSFQDRTGRYSSLASAPDSSATDPGS